MSRLSKLQDSFQDFIDKIKDSDAYHEIKNRYDELDAKVKLYINIGAASALTLFISYSVLSGISKAHDMQTDIEARSELVHYLQDAADRIQHLKLQRESQNLSADAGAPLQQFVQNIGTSIGLNNERMKVGDEKNGQTLKDSQEILIEAVLSQTNIKTLTRFLYTLTDQGTSRSLTVKDLTVDTKGDPDGYLDATVTLVAYRAK